MSTENKRFGVIDFFLLLIYSLSPGIYKILGNQMFMLLSIPIIILLILKPGIKIRFYKLDLLFFFFIFYIVSLNLIQLLQPQTNRTALFMGIFLDMIPMAGFIYSRKLPFDLFAKILIPIGIVHLIIGIFLYPLFGINAILGDISTILLDGVAFGRMSSVSGSLGFAVLMFLTCISALYYNRKIFFFLLLGVICAAQRSGWLACLWGCFFYALINFKKNNYSFIRNLIMSIIVFVGIITFTINKTGFDTSFFSQRFEDIGSATNERDEQWLAGINNILKMPIGAGSGQVGQVAARYESSEYMIVSDGDYFRVLSEFGLGGGMFYFALLFLVLLSIINVKSSYSKQRCCLLSLMGGQCIQMIGSNITEFFFTNFLYWILVGYIFTELNSIFVNSRISINKL